MDVDTGTDDWREGRGILSHMVWCVQEKMALALARRMATWNELSRRTLASDLSKTDLKFDELVCLAKLLVPRVLLILDVDRIRQPLNLFFLFLTLSRSCLPASLTHTRVQYWRRNTIWESRLSRRWPHFFFSQFLQFDAHSTLIEYTGQVNMKNDNSSARRYSINWKIAPVAYNRPNSKTRYVTL